jgi:hypothetical protein
MSQQRMVAADAEVLGTLIGFTDLAPKKLDPTLVSASKELKAQLEKLVSHCIYFLLSKIICRT